MSEQPAGVDMHSLTFTDEPAGEVPPRPRGPDDVKVPRTYRLPVELDEWITRTASTRGVQRSDLVRNLLELGRGVFESADRPVSMAAVLSALASIPPHDAA